MKRQILTAAIALVAAAASAQENQLSIDAQLRTRGEHNQGAIVPLKDGEQSANFINERARLTIDWQRQNLEMKVGVQHTGVWGQDDIKQPNGRATMNEAWAKLTTNDEHFFAQIGRQQLAYDDERLLGTLDWNVNGNWHDALKLGYQSLSSQLHLVLAMNQTAENNRGDYYDGPMPYKNMEMLWYHYQSQMLPLGVSLMAINTGLEIGTSGHGRTNYMQTVGTDVTFKPLDWNLHAAFYYQLGKDYYSRDVNAFMASAKAEYIIDPLLQVNVGYDYLSGGNTLTEAKAFNALYGTHHKFYGAMDFFPGTFAYGLHDIQAGASSLILPWLSARADYHCFLTAEQLGSYYKMLGHEVDVQLQAKVMKDVILTGGCSAFFGTETMDAIKGGNHDKWQGWGWLQLNINPRVLFAKW